MVQQLTTRFYTKKINDQWSTNIANEDIKQGELIGITIGTFSPRTRFTIQASKDRHVDVKGGLEYTNHSCDPNASFIVNAETAEVSLVAIRDITAGEELCFDYATTEWDMAEKFECQCGKKLCRGRVGGAKHLSDEEVARLTPYFSEVIRDQLRETSKLTS